MNFGYRPPLNTQEIYTLAELAYQGSPWSYDTFEHDITNEHAYYLIVTVAEKPVGFIAGTLIIDELSISNVAVIPAFRRQNIAKRLCEHWLKTFKPGIKVFLEVRSSNIAAINLYHLLGFQQIARRNAYYHHPVEDALIMEKKL